MTRNETPEEKKARIDKAADDFIAFKLAHPSVWYVEGKEKDPDLQGEEACRPGR